MENLYPDYFKEDDHYSIKVKVAKDSATPPHILEHLSNDDNWMVRSGVALNPNTPPEVLTKLAHSKQRNIRYRVSKNPNTPEEVLYWLVVDKDKGTVMEYREYLKKLEKEMEAYQKLFQILEENGICFVTPHQLSQWRSIRS